MVGSNAVSAKPKSIKEDQYQTGLRANAEPAQTGRDKLKADYAEYVKKTKAVTTGLMKYTGLVYKHLPVWECQSSQTRQ